MKESTKNLIYDVFMILVSVAFLTIGIFNVINYSDIERDKNDENLGMSRTWIEVCFWLNIVLVAISGYFTIYSIIKLFFRPESKMKDIIKQIFGEKAKSDFNMTLSVGKNPIEGIQVAAAMATSEARKSGKDLRESIKIGTIAGTVAGTSSGINKGDSKVISKLASENVIRNELSKYKSKDS